MRWIKSLYRRFLLFVLDSRAFNWMILHVFPYVRFSLYYTDLQGYQYQAGYEILKPGDILCSVDHKKFVSWVIPGEVSHAALCVDKGVPWEISEMTHSHYTKSTFFDFCKQADRVLILRCPAWDAEYLEQVLEKCRSLQDARYDSSFKFGIETLYCSELVFVSDFENRMQASMEDLAGLGRKYVSPVGILHAPGVVKVWDSRDCPEPF